MQQYRGAAGAVADQHDIQPFLLLEIRKRQAQTFKTLVDRAHIAAARSVACEQRQLHRQGRPAEAGQFGAQLVDQLRAVGVLSVVMHEQRGTVRPLAAGFAE